MEKEVEELRQAIREFDEERGRKLVEEAVKKGIDPLKIIEEGLAKELRQIGEKFSRGEVFIVDLIGAAKVMETSMEVLQPILEKSGEKLEFLGRVLIGTVEGDIHDIGKNIVASVLKASGFEVHDLGKDVSAQTFIDKVREMRPDVVGASALLTTTMPMQEEIIKALRKENLRSGVKVIVGGAPCSSEWAQKIGADGYAEDAIEAVNLVKTLLDK